MRIFNLFLFLLLLVSCSKPGCTDSNALNYAAGAGKNDGSCIYKDDITVLNNLDLTIEEFTLEFGPGIPNLHIHNPSFSVSEGDIVILEVETGTTTKYWTALPYMLGADAFLEGSYSDQWSGIVISSYYTSGNPTVWSSNATYKFRAALIKKNGLNIHPEFKDMTIAQLMKL